MDKMQGGDIKVENRFTKWFDNFWYHYKWTTIGIVFALFVIIVCTLQMCEKEKVDIYVMYGGPDVVEGEQLTNFRAALKAVLPEDFNGDGEKYADVVANFIMSKDEIEEAHKEHVGTETTDDFYIDPTFMSQNKQKFDNLIVAGEYSVCFLSPYLYEEVKAANGFMPLAEIFEEMPEGAIDEYGLRLLETDFGSYFPGVNELPPDTILCMRRIGTLSSFLNKGATEKTYEKSNKLFRAIVDYEAPND
ncbi:MAG: hypothetical protein IJZ89_01400 [Clostridia bacterium]|nr:hypothetical protein [Clostridia bacterium]